MLIARGVFLKQKPVMIEEESSRPAEAERTRLRFEQAKRNSDWLQAHWNDILPAARSKYVAVAGQEAFVADTHAEAWARCQKAHPEDLGAISQFVPPAEEL